MLVEKVVRKKAHQVFTFVKAEISKLRFVEASALIGKPVLQREIHPVMDLDTVIILKDPMTKEKYTAIDRIFRKARGFSDSRVGITYAIKDVPMKIHAKQPATLFLHVILHTVSSYRGSPLLLVKNSWQYEGTHIAGKSLRAVQKLPGVSRKLLLDGVLGIRHCMDMAQKGESAYLSWDKKKGKYANTLHKLKFRTLEDLLEIYYYSVLRCASNAVRWKTKKSKGLGINEEMARKFSKLFRISLHEYPLFVVEEKRALRLHQARITRKLVKQTKERTLEFLKQLENAVLLSK